MSEPMGVREALEVGASAAEECFLQDPDLKYIVEEYEEAAAVLRRLLDSGFLEAAMAYNAIMLADMRNARRMDEAGLKIDRLRGEMYDAYRAFTKEPE